MGEFLREGEIREVNIDSVKPSKTLMRSVDSNKVKQLADSISMFGLRHPITISDDNYLISGNHRLEAVRSLGKKTIRAEIVHVSGLMARILMVEENLIRADLTSLEQAEYLAEHNKLLIELGARAGAGKPSLNKNDKVRSSAPLKTTKEIAKEMGMAERTLQEKIQIANDIDQSARDKLRGSDIADNKSELLRLAKVEGAEDQNAVVDSVIKGDCKTIKEAVSTLTRNKQRKEFADLTSEVRKLPDTVKFLCKDFFEVEGDDDFIKHNTIDAIITDPPYVDEWKENWTPFLGIAADILKPGGFLITYVGHIRLPEFFEAIRETQVESGGKISKNNKLEFFWINALEHTGSITAVHSRSVQCGYKPIIIAFKPPMKKPYKYFNDLMKGSGKSKSHHDWEQSVEELIPMFDAFTKPGDTVLDPFMGSGTTGIAAKMTARKFIGYDISQENVDIATKRIFELESNK
jgi:ParB-like chromosome segregation protein Spo0J